jgi:transposase
MATLTATRCNPLIKPFYERLIAKGKGFRRAMVACARKLLILLNTLVKEKRPWRPLPT